MPTVTITIALDNCELPKLNRLLAGFIADNEDVYSIEGPAATPAEPLEIEPEPLPEPEPTPAPKRKHRVATPAPTPEPEPEPTPEPEPEVKPTARTIPSTEALKSIVTQAVRLAQKKEGPAKILELLPAFKTKTGLGFVMEATDAHREALADLIEAAGLVGGTA